MTRKVPPQKPPTEFVRASDVVPYEWAQWCTIEDSEPFANDIVGVTPADDGIHLWFMLETFNFMKVKPDDVLELIPRLPFAEEITDASAPVSYRPAPLG